MNCPLCLDTTLEVTFHAGIELDICPRCRGVWLDRGELERIAGGTPRGDDRRSAAPPTADRRPDGRRDDRRDDDRWDDDRFDDDRWDDDLRSERGRDDRGRPRRKKTLAQRLGDVFEEVLDF